MIAQLWINHCPQYFYMPIPSALVPFIWGNMLMNPHLSQQYAGLQQKVLQPQQEGTRDQSYRDFTA